MIRQLFAWWKCYRALHRRRVACEANTGETEVNKKAQRKKSTTGYCLKRPKRTGKGTNAQQLQLSQQDSYTKEANATCIAANRQKQCYLYKPVLPQNAHKNEAFAISHAKPLRLILEVPPLVSSTGLVRVLAHLVRFFYLQHFADLGLMDSVSERALLIQLRTAIRLTLFAANPPDGQMSLAWLLHAARTTSHKTQHWHYIKRQSVIATPTQLNLNTRRDKDNYITITRVSIQIDAVSVFYVPQNEV